MVHTMKTIHVLWFAIFILYGCLYYVRFSIGYFQPDELLFLGLNNTINIESLKLKYLITSFFMRSIYAISPFALLLFNLFLVFFTIKHCEKKKYFASKCALWLIFLSPSVIFFAVSYLRDFYVYLSVLFFILSLIDRELKKTFFVTIALILLLRIEVGLIILCSLLLAKIRNPYALIISFFIYFFLVVVSLNFTTSLTSIIEVTSGRLEDSYKGGVFSLVGLGFDSWGLSIGLIAAYFSFFSPFIFVLPQNAFQVFLFFNSVFAFVGLLAVLVGFKRAVYRRSYTYRVLIISLICVFPLSLIQSEATSANRFSLSFYLIILFVNFIRFDTVVISSTKRKLRSMV